MCYDPSMKLNQKSSRIWIGVFIIAVICIGMLIFYFLNTRSIQPQKTPDSSQSKQSYPSYYSESIFTKDWKTFTSPTNKISIKYPNSWKPKSTDQTYSWLETDKIIFQQYNPSIQIRRDLPDPSSEFTSFYKEALKAQVGETLKVPGGGDKMDIYITRFEDGNADGYKTIKIKTARGFPGSSDVSDPDEYIVFFVKNNNFTQPDEIFQIAFVSNGLSVTTGIDIVDTMLTTLKVLN